jgi:hypothetical protein
MGRGGWKGKEGENKVESPGLKRLVKKKANSKVEEVKCDEKGKG